MKHKKKIKMLEMWEDTHRSVKAQSAMRDMTMKDYLKWLVDNDTKMIMKGLK